MTAKVRRLEAAMASATRFQSLDEALAVTG
jgi:hypothetical protein